MKLYITLFTACVLSACGSNGFEGSNDTSGKNNREGASATSSPVIQGDNLSANDIAINKCLAKFTGHPFGQNDFSDYRVIRSRVQVLGFGAGVVDTEVTAKPKLILINSSVNVLSKTAYELKNPNGWYCFNSNVSVLGNTAVKIHCQSKLTDTSNDVNVLSNTTGESFAKSGVNVLSKMKTEKIGTCN